MPKRKHTPIREQQARWERYIRLTLAPSTFKRYSFAVERFLTHNRRRCTTPGSFNRCVLEDWKAHCVRRGLSPHYIETELGAIKGFFRWMERMGVIAVSPFRLVRGVPLPQVKRVTITKVIRELDSIAQLEAEQIKVALGELKDRLTAILPAAAPTDRARFV